MSVFATVAVCWLGGEEPRPAGAGTQRKRSQAVKTGIFRTFPTRCKPGEEPADAASCGLHGIPTEYCIPPRIERSLDAIIRHLDHAKSRLLY